MSIKRFLPFLALAFLMSCSSNHKPLHDATIRHAHLLQMENMTSINDEAVFCRILNPWQEDRPVMQYLLLPASDSTTTEKDLMQIEKDYGRFQLLRTPLSRMTLTTSCHGYLLSQIDAFDCIAAYCDAQYLIADTLKQLLKQHSITDAGSSLSPNSEAIISAQCDAFWVSPFENTNWNQIEQLRIPIIYCADYMENSPLGRAEWMRFYGRVVGHAAESDSLFSFIEHRYDSICMTHQPDSTTIQKKLLPEIPTGQTWYVPGGRSTSGFLYRDAGYDYPWGDDIHAGSLSLSPEAVLIKASDCDRWLFKYYAPEKDWSMDDFLSQNTIFSQFKAVTEHEVYGCNTAKSDFFDVTPFRPDLLLECLADSLSIYFKKLE